MLIRRLVPADAASYLSLRLAALRQSPAAFSSSYEEECGTPLATIETRLAPDSGRLVFGAVDGATLVGMVVLGREDGNKVRHKGFIRGMYVASAYRGRGASRQMLEQALDAATVIEGLQQLTLSVTAGNAPALALYQSLGFVVFAQAPRALLVDGVFHDDVYMVLHLPRELPACVRL